MYYRGGFFYTERFSVLWTSVHSVCLCKTMECEHFSVSILNSLFHLMLLIQHIISDMENEFMAWFHVFFFDDVIEIRQLVGYFEKQAIPRINGYFDVTVSMHFDSQFRSHIISK